jgi:rod shape-determining protein MreC
MGLGNQKIKTVFMKSRIRQKSVTGFAPHIFMGGTSSSFIFVIIAMLLLVFGLVRPQALSGFRIAATDIITPTLSAISRPFQNIATTVGNISGLASLRAENAQLKTENTRLREWYQTALMLQAENQSLQELLNLKINPSHKYITSRVISDAGNAFVKTILIETGHADGVENNQAVLAGEGMIGRIIEAGRNASRVLLITDINSRIPVLIEGSQQKAIMSGNNKGHPILKHLPRDSSLIEGARVVTSGDGGVFPAGFPIGRLMLTANGKFVVKPFADMQKVTYVRVIEASSENNIIRGSISALD